MIASIQVLLKANKISLEKAKFNEIQEFISILPKLSDSEKYILIQYLKTKY
jgi:hypothetical protein